MHIFYAAAFLAMVSSLILVHPLFADIEGDIELLRSIADGYEANLEKLRTWKAKVTLKGFHTAIPATDWGERQWESQNEFLLDRDQDAIRWHGETVKGTQTLEGKTSPLPQDVHSGMIKSEYNYRLTFPENEKGRRNLLIIPSGQWPRNFESNIFDPIHILTKEIYPGLLEQLRGYYKLQSEGKLSFSNGSITRQRDIVTVETDNDRGDYGRIITRFVFDLSKGCCLTEFFTSSKVSESHWKLDYEKLADVWVMKKVAHIHKDKREGSKRISTREAVLTNEMVNKLVAPEEFELDKIGMRPGDIVYDRVMGGVSYEWKKDLYPREMLEETCEIVLAEAESFENLGGWVVDQQFMDQMGSPFLLAHGLGQPVKDATTTVSLPVKGRYRLWVRTRDWVAPWNAPGVPGKFQLLVDGEPLKTTFGNEGAEWYWQDGGTVEITSRQVTLSLHDLTGFEGRCDAIVLTSDMDFLPPNEGSEMAEFRRKALGLPEQPQDAGQYDLVVVGGGIAGTCTAVSAARLGLQVALIQDRPVLGGNNSSEVRVHLGGKINLPPYPELGNIVKELDSGHHGNAREARYYDDQKKLRVARREKNLSLFLNMHVYQVEKKGDRIVAVIAKHTRSSKELRFVAPLFADCTGDGTIGFLAGADYRMGRESTDQTGELLAPEKADKMTLGTSVMWYSVETAKPAPFPECLWALQFNQKTCQNATMGNWDWETGLHRDTITEAEYIRDHMLRAIYGNWAFQKNTSADKEKYAWRKLAWVAYIAGKRESRRLLGDVILKQQDIQQQRKFPDAFITTTWSIDLHYPQPKNAEQFDEPFRAIADQKPIKPYPIPYRCLYSCNIGNLFMAGRDISVTHVALGTVRIMRTCGMMGELVGMAASLCKKYNTSPRGIYQHHLAELKELAQRGVGKADVLAECEAGSIRPSAYLSAQELLDLYESMYSKIHNVHVIYTNMLEETKGDSPRLKRYTRFDTSEIIEEEGCEKFYRRWSSAPEGFEDPDGTIAEKAFNGSATSQYYPVTEFGSINPGRTARAVDELNMLWAYMLLYRPQPYEKPDEPLIRYWFSDKSRVRRQLEQVSGEWCHVVDSFSRDKSKPYATVWIAADKNGLPMKFERNTPGSTRRIIVTKVGSVETDTGKIWFPEQASKEFNDRYGYTLYRFHVQSLRVNIETTPDMFKVSFPPGTDVIDHVAGTYYTIGPLGEKMRVGVLPDPLRKFKHQGPIKRGVGKSKPSESVKMVFPEADWQQATAESQGLDSNRLEAAVSYLRDNSGPDGVNELVIIRNGYMIWKGSNIDKVHGVWSLTKSFTSTVLGLLIDDGKATLETLAKDYVPSMAKTYPTVTLRHFATMTSGYYAVGDEPRGSYKHGPSLTPFLPGEEPLFAPGTKYAYWDSAMNQFANTLTRIAGEPIEELFKRRIAEPIGMNPSKWDWGDFGDVDGMVVNGGSGNQNKHIFISARGLARFGHLFLNRGLWNGRRLISQSWIDAATKAHVPASLPLEQLSGADGRGVYGFNWWTNGVKPDGQRKWPDAPAGTYSASGYNNNDMFVIPEWNMVIVRLGLDERQVKITDAIYNTFLQKVGLAITGPDTGNSASETAPHYLTGVQSTPYSPFKKALENGRLANEGFIRCRNFVKGWLKHADPATCLIPRNLSKDKDIWNAKDSAADNYPFMVLTAALTDRQLFEGRMLDMLRTETKLTSRIGAMPDTYSFSKQGFQSAQPEIDQIIFGSSEYIKDGLLPLTEWLGPSSWSKRMIAILDDIWKHAPIETKYGRIPSASQEVNGEMLQTLARIYWMTGEKKYLAWAVRLGDYYLLDEHHPTKNQKRLSLDDHGCEVISGLCELYAMLHFIEPHKKSIYEKPIHQMLDRILEVGRDKHGLFYDWINPLTGQHADSLTDNWGYNLNGFYVVYLIDKTESYHQAVRKALGNLNKHYKDYKWEGGRADGYADSIEGAINLYNREQVDSVADWLDSQTKVMWDIQKPDGIIEGWHGDGNFARTTIMYCLWRTKGLTIRPWREDVIFGAVQDDEMLKITLRAEKPWQGKLIFDPPRYKTVMKLPLDWPRINQFPEWFTVKAERCYVVHDLTSNLKQIYTGKQLREGLSIDLEPGTEYYLIVERKEL